MNESDGFNKIVEMGILTSQYKLSLTHIVIMTIKIFNKIIDHLVT